MFLNKYRYHISYFYFNFWSNEPSAFFRVSSDNFFYFLYYFKSWGICTGSEFSTFFKIFKKKKKKKFNSLDVKINFRSYSAFGSFYSYKMLSTKRNFIYLTNKFLHFFLKKLNYVMSIVSKKKIFFINIKGNLDKKGFILNLFLN